MFEEEVAARQLYYHYNSTAVGVMIVYYVLVIGVLIAVCAGTIWAICGLTKGQGKAR